MKVLQVCAYAAPYEGNFIKSIAQLENVVKNNNGETIYCFPEAVKCKPWFELFSKDRTIYYLPIAKASFRRKTYNVLRTVFREHNDIEIVHSHFELYDVAVTLTAPKSVKLFWHLHDAIGQNLHGFNTIKWKLHYSLFSKNVCLLSVSEKHKRVAINLGFNPDKAIFLPNAIDLNRINKQDSNRICKYDFLMFGWQWKRKGVDLALDALAQLPQPFSLCIITGEKEETFHIGNSTVDLVNPKTDINEVYTSAKCFLHISRAEGMSYALLEAIYSGLPVIVSNIEENMIARDFPNVTMVNVDDVSSIKGAMLELYKRGFMVNDEDVVKSRTIIHKVYSIDSWAERIYHLYLNCA